MANSFQISHKAPIGVRSTNDCVLWFSLNKDSRCYGNLKSPGESGDWQFLLSHWGIFYFSFANKIIE